MSVILITGCSTGIGYAAAETLARNGHTVYGTMRNPKGAPQLSQLADDHNLPITVLPLNVTDEQSIRNAVSLVLSKEEAIDVLVNNAGIGVWTPVEETSMEQFEAVMDTNFYGTVRCIKAVLPSMRERKSGTIINVTSCAGRTFFNFFGPYCSSKAAVEALSETLGQELAPFKIRVAVVEPGVIDTPIFDNVRLNASTNYPNIKRFLSFFAASLERHTPAMVVADVINDIVSGTSTSFRNLAGPDAAGLLQMRAATTDEDWINSVCVSDIEWTDSMEQAGLGVRKFMEAGGLPQLKVDELQTV